MLLATQRGSVAEGWLYLAVSIDAYSRRVVDRALAAHLRTALALAALRMALRARCPGAGLTGSCSRRRAARRPPTDRDPATHARGTALPCRHPATSLTSSRSQSTVLPTATQSSQSPEVSGMVPNASCMNGR